MSLALWVFVLLALGIVAWVLYDKPAKMQDPPAFPDPSKFFFP